MMRFDSRETIDTVMRRQPGTIRILLKHGMACIGCAIAPYHTIGEVGAEYDLPIDEFLHELVEAAKTG